MREKAVLVLNRRSKSRKDVRRSRHRKNILIYLSANSTVVDLSQAVTSGGRSHLFQVNYVFKKLKCRSCLIKGIKISVIIIKLKKRINVLKSYMIFSQGVKGETEFFSYIWEIRLAACSRPKKPQLVDYITHTSARAKVQKYRYSGKRGSTDLPFTSLLE